MAETKKFVVEGDVSLAYFAEESDSRHVLLKPEKSNASEGALVDSSQGVRLEAKIANELNFPTDAEFDQLYRQLDDMRERGVRPADGVPNVTRDGVRLRITVEVL
ncbi:MAG: hypothetical protein ACYS7Y_11630 [Planctomycetota bacterium]|jgi:hypothetical protein